MTIQLKGDSLHRQLITENWTSARVSLTKIVDRGRHFCFH
jgi:hypothetical protein